MRKPGKGNIFGDRFKSTLIENDSYLITSIMYTLFNPARAGIVRHYSRADWTSIGEMLHDHPKPLIDRDFVLDLFGDFENFVQQMNEYGVDGRLKVDRTRFGEVLGSENCLYFQMFRKGRWRACIGMPRREKEEIISHDKFK